MRTPVLVMDLSVMEAAYRRFTAVMLLLLNV